MKVLIQRVKEASVEIENQLYSQIKSGMLIFCCFENGDSEEQIQKACIKIKNLRIFEDDKGKMNLNLEQANAQVLCVSQFTLSWDGQRGNRPSFDRSLDPRQAVLLYRNFISTLSKIGVDVKEGQFAANMQVKLVNDGPVTFFIEFP